MESTTQTNQDPLFLANVQDLVPNSGVCALYDQGDETHEIALFYVPDSDAKIYAVSNWDPIGKASVMSRGMVGSIGDKLVVASPLYKQHFCLQTGACLEEEVSLSVYQIEQRDGAVYLQGIS